MKYGKFYCKISCDLEIKVNDANSWYNPNSVLDTQLKNFWNVLVQDCFIIYLSKQFFLEMLFKTAYFEIESLAERFHRSPIFHQGDGI